MDPRHRQLFMRRPDLENLPPLPPLPAGYELRLATAGDAEAIASVMRSAFGPDPDWTAERVRRALLDAADVKRTFVVTADGKPAATASARIMPEAFPGSGYVHWVAADADHRGKDLGKIVSIAVLRSFRELGCKDAVLETDPPRLPAIRLYLDLGFLPENVVPEHEALWREIFAKLARSGAASRPRLPADTTGDR